MQFKKKIHAHIKFNLFILDYLYILNYLKHAADTLGNHYKFQATACQSQGLKPSLDN